MVTQYIEVLQSYGNPNTLKCFNKLKCFNLMKVTIGLQHFNILVYHSITILQYTANYLFLQRTLTAYVSNYELEIVNPELETKIFIEYHESQISKRQKKHFVRPVWDKYVERQQWRDYLNTIFR